MQEFTVYVRKEIMVEFEPRTVIAETLESAEQTALAQTKDENGDIAATVRTTWRAVANMSQMS